jgi:hypothetical protein
MTAEKALEWLDRPTHSGFWWVSTSASIDPYPCEVVFWRPEEGRFLVRWIDNEEPTESTDIDEDTMHRKWLAMEKPAPPSWVDYWGPSGRPP